MAPKHHPAAPLSGGDREALKKELSKSRVMTRIFAERSAEKRREGEVLIREADNLACQSWNEKMWSDGGPYRSVADDRSGHQRRLGWRSSARAGQTPRDVDLCACAPRADDMRARSRPGIGLPKVQEAGKRPAATLAPHERPR
jgi:hypothetical protein